jgi:hypothetical protein
MHRGRAELAHRARIFSAVSLFRSFDIELRHHILIRPEKSITALCQVSYCIYMHTFSGPCLSNYDSEK